jgi:uncharacterized membrane protein YkvA (DUF1232 family)
MPDATEDPPAAPAWAAGPVVPAWPADTTATAGAADTTATAGAPLDGTDPGDAAFGHRQGDPEGWRFLTAEAPEVVRLLRGLATDPRVSWRAKALAASALAYVAAPIDLLPGPAVVDDLVILVWALRRLVASAGYDVVRERWTGSDRGFAWLIVLTGVDA